MTRFHGIYRDFDVRFLLQKPLVWNVLMLWFHLKADGGRSLTYLFLFRGGAGRGIREGPF